MYRTDVRYKMGEGEIEQMFDIMERWKYNKMQRIYRTR